LPLGSLVLGVLFREAIETIGQTNKIDNGKRTKIVLKMVQDRNFYKITIKTTFWGGFAVDADFGDGFSGSIEGPKIVKKP
jgi:hypothetical protein